MNNKNEMIPRALRASSGTQPESRKVGKWQG